MKCVLCKKKASTAAFSPFCSQNCQNLDLISWMNEEYCVPGDPCHEPSDEEEQSPQPPLDATQL